MNIGVIGLGKLGLPMLAAFVKKGFPAQGYDKDRALSENLRNRLINSKEPGVKDTAAIDAEWPQRFAYDLESIYNFSNFLFLVLPAPANVEGLFDTENLSNTIKQLIVLDKKHSKPIDLIITTTINPGDSECLLELVKDTRINLLYSPAFISLGSVIDDLVNPSFTIIGSDVPFAADRLEWVYGKLQENKSSICHLSHLEAEIVKIAVNTYAATKISFANTIGSMVHTFTHGDMHKVKRTLETISLDTRVNPSGFKFGGSFGGPCVVKDNKNLGYHLRRKGLSSHIPSAIENVNNYIVEYWAKKLQNNIYSNICYVGLSYKPNTDCVEDSFIIDLHHKIKRLDKKYYFIDQNVDQFPNIIKVIDNNLDNDSTLYVINHGNDDLLGKLRQYANVFELWA